MYVLSELNCIIDLIDYVQTVLSLSDQLELFKDYITKLKKIAGEERSSTILREGLVTVFTGSNDITNTYFLTPLRQSHYDVPSYIDLLLSYASTFVQVKKTQKNRTWLKNEKLYK